MANGIATARPHQMVIHRPKNHAETWLGKTANGCQGTYERYGVFNRNCWRLLVVVFVGRMCVESFRDMSLVLHCWSVCVVAYASLSQLCQVRLYEGGVQLWMCSPNRRQETTTDDLPSTTAHSEESRIRSLCERCAWHVVDLYSRGGCPHVLYLKFRFV